MDITFGKIMQIGDNLQNRRPHIFCKTKEFD